MIVEDSDAPDEHGATPSGPGVARAQDHGALRRTLVAGALTVALACGFMGVSAAALPWNTFGAHPDFTEPLPSDEVPDVPVVGTSSSTGPRTVAQVLDAVGRAEVVAAEAGRSAAPDVQQAAAELGLLLVTYVAQQEAQVEPRVGAPAVRTDVLDLGETPAPELPLVEAGGVAPDPTDPLVPSPLRPPAEVAPDADGAGDSVDGALDGSPDSGAGTAPGTQDVPALDAPTLESPEPSVPGPDGEGAAFSAASTVSNVVQPDLGSTEPRTTDDATEDPETMHDPGAGSDAVTGTTPGAHPDDESDGHEHPDEAVTFDDVVIAATNLTTLLDPATATYVLDVRPAITELPDGTLVNDEGLPVDANGLPIGLGTPGLTDALQTVVDRYAGTTAGYANGRIPASVLCEIPWAPWHMLRCDAAAQLESLNTAYRAEFGTDIPITDSYRSYDAQVAVRAAKPTLAAVPGTSNHGWGLALDLSTPISGGTSAEYAWLRVHGPDYGWDNPTWARPDGRKPEPWHFEFFAAGPIPDRASTDYGTDWASGTGSTGATSQPADTEADGDKDKAEGSGQGKDKGKDKDTKQGDKGADKGTGSGGATKGDDPKGDKDTTPTPKPKPTPTPGPTPKPTATPKPSPTPKPTSSPKPSPSPEPSPTETAEPTPEPTPTETAKPTPEPTPTETAEPAPEPEPEPTEDASEPTPEASPSEAAPEPEQDGGGSGDEEPAGTAAAAPSTTNGRSRAGRPTPDRGGDGEQE
ncbi:M15 family metallopeptidase [Isoptericola dokdonensis]|uniref:D-alanyl-D-alanine carboxypeptidase n=1 Tax=Isoptericola dokdonensis DS-3 TaxID=1300344 RepID=A0A161IJC0_9MICO|nr:M15 family metallopeptidase [Isoptericola dokdonensis]ANC32104.1 D-alanyl-D-alanine carboxypeptidase [Isoptericola dokdonensis DS-3]